MKIDITLPVIGIVFLSYSIYMLYGIFEMIAFWVLIPIVILVMNTSGKIFKKY